MDLPSMPKRRWAEMPLGRKYHWLKTSLYLAFKI
jgi:hypothetical protein